MGRILSRKQLIRSGFPYSEYSFIEQPGEYEAVLDNKCWGYNNLLLFFTLLNADRSKVITAAWRNSGYHGLKNSTIGSRVLLLFKKSSTGSVYLVGVEKLGAKKGDYGEE